MVGLRGRVWWVFEQKHKYASIIHINTNANLIGANLYVCPYCLVLLL